MKIINLSKIIGFDWDKGNKEKNKKKHNVEKTEAEEGITLRPIFFNDRIHSDKEKRYIALGITEKKRFLFISFTIRGNKIRVISARDQDKKEKLIYIKSMKGGENNEETK